MTFFQLVSKSWGRNFKVDYTFQFYYRRMAISEYFKKEILFALLMTLTFQLVNEEYRQLFAGPRRYIGYEVDADGNEVLDANGQPILAVTESHGMYGFTNYEVEE